MKCVELAINLTFSNQAHTNVQILMYFDFFGFWERFKIYFVAINFKFLLLLMLHVVCGVCIFVNERVSKYQ